MLTICDKCNHKYNIEQKDLKIERKEDIEETYFDCPKCNEKYIVMRTNEEVRKLGQRFIMAKEKINKINRPRLKEKQIKLMRRYQEAYKKALDKFNGKG